MNVILAISDTFRYDNLSCYGPTKVKTPNLDKLAKESHVFNNAYLGSFPTVPNRQDIMSGRFNFIDHEWCPLPPETVTLQQILSASGIVTQMIVDNPHLIENGFNCERGFDGWEWIRGQETDHWKTLPRDVKIPASPSKLRDVESTVPNYLRNTSWWQSEEDRFAARSVNEACKWLEKQDAENFFLYLDLFDPHEPWDAPKKYLDLYEKDYKGQEVMYPFYDHWKNFLTKEELDHMRAQYMAECTMVDHWIGVLRDKIEKLGLDDDTAFIFTSDHGFFFGEHGCLGKAFHIDKMYFEACRMYDVIRRIPLMIHLPGQKKGKQIDALVQPPDLMPTILELSGLVASECIEGSTKIQALQCGTFYTKDWQFKPEDIHGKSLMPLVRGETDRLRDIAVCSNTIIHHTPIVAKCAVVTEEGWCLHYAGDYTDEVQEGIIVNTQAIKSEPMREKIEPSLYYIPDDPGEENDLIQKNGELANKIHQRYVKWLEEVGTPEEHIAGRRKLGLKGEAGK